MALSLQNALISQNSDDSDEEDDDYVPSGADESEDEVEDAEGGDDELTEAPSGQRKKKKLKAQKNVKSRKRKGGITLSDDDEASGNDVEKEEDAKSPICKTEQVTPEIEKKKSDSLWADFLSDVSPPPAKKKTNPVSSISMPISTSFTSLSKPISKPEKVTITQVFEFAGESVEVKKEVESNSDAAKAFAREQEKKSQIQSSSSSTQKCEQPPRLKKVDGLSAVLGKVLDKKSKLSTLEKSKLDWNNFKKDEGVEEDLDQYKRSKHGYLERQAFLQRTDLRQFEIEKSLRDTNRSHRV